MIGLVPEMRIEVTSLEIDLHMFLSSEAGSTRELLPFALGFARPDELPANSASRGDSKCYHVESQLAT